MPMRTALLTLLLLATTTAVPAQENPCPCIPTSYEWVVTACETWNCAASAAILSNGDPFVMAVPTASTKYRWVVLRRIVTGTAAVSPDSPFLIDAFHTLPEASSHFSVIDHDALPMLITTVDGNMLVLRLREPERRRSVSH